MQAGAQDATDFVLLDDTRFAQGEKRPKSAANQIDPAKTAGWIMPANLAGANGDEEHSIHPRRHVNSICRQSSLQVKSERGIVIRTYPAIDEIEVFNSAVFTVDVYLLGREKDRRGGAGADEFPKGEIEIRRALRRAKVKFRRGVVCQWPNRAVRSIAHHQHEEGAQFACSKACG